MFACSNQRVPLLTRILLACCLVSSLFAHLHAQDLRYLRHRSWYTEDGLPQDSVRQIYQANDGFLWIATEGGLARFDGISFSTFNHLSDPAFLSDDICCIAENPSGALWFGTDDGLLQFKDGKFHRFDQHDGLPSAAIEALSSAPGVSLTVVTAQGSVMLDSAHFVPVRSPIARAPETPWTSSSTTITFTSGRSSHHWRAGTDLPGTRIETLFIDRAGTAWVGTNDGLAVIRDGHASLIASLSGNAVTQVFEDHEGNHWIATETSGLHVLRLSSFRTEPALADEALTSVVQASDGSIWFGTRKDGIRRLLNGVVETPVRPNQLTSPFILSMAPGTKGSVWVGTPDGLNHLSATGTVQQVTSVDGLPDDYILALASAPDGTVWAGTRKGLARLQGTAIQTVTLANGLGSNLIGSLLLTAAGNLWIGTSAGLSRRSPDGKIITFTQADGVPPTMITALAISRDESVWITTGEDGLIRFAKGGFKALKLPSVSPRILGAIVDTQNYLWLRSQLGAQRISIADLNACLAAAMPCFPHTRTYGLADGLPSIEAVPGASPAFWTMADGELWTTTLRGVAITNTVQLPPIATPPPVAIEQFLVDDTAIPTNNRLIQIPYGPLRFTIEFAALSYTSPSEIQYRFRLDGLDSSWTEAGNRRFATYTNLPPRSYRFSVQAKNNDSSWNEAGATLQFQIIPPFYRRWWFLALIILCFAAIAAALYRLRLRRLQRHFNLILDERNRMAREIHDTLAQDFVGITLQLDLITQLLSHGSVDAAEKQLLQTRKLVTEGLADARNSIWELRANLDQNSLPTRLTKIVDRYSNSDLHTQLKMGGAYRPLDAKVEVEVLRIAQEALSNVRRHSAAAHVSIDLRYRDDLLILTVTDDGRGFIVDDALEAEMHYGLKGMKERAAVLRAKLDITSKPGAGTEVKLIAAIVPPQG